MGARAATRSSMRRRRACSSTCAVRSRAKSCGCTSRPTSTAAAASFRLRHAYGSCGGLLAGQTWSTFVDDNNFPNTIDFESPMAFPSIRQAQLRWTQKLGANVSWSAAVEDNKSTIVTPAAIPGKAEYPMPDLATHVRFEGSRGHAFASVFLGRARFRPVDGEPDDVTLWGMLLSGRVKTFGKDYAYGQFTFGDGVGRYRGGMTAVPDANGQLQRRRAHRVHGRLRALLVRPALVERRLQPGVGAGEGLTTRPISTRTSTTPPSIFSTGSSRTARGPASSTCTAAARSSTTGPAAPIGFSSRFVSISPRNTQEHFDGQDRRTQDSITSSRRSPRASTSGGTWPGPRRHGPHVRPAAATRPCRPRATRRSPRSCPWRISRPTRARGC